VVHEIACRSASSGLGDGCTAQVLPFHASAKVEHPNVARTPAIKPKSVRRVMAVETARPFSRP
jgi:hypothetical protein